MKRKDLENNILKGINADIIFEFNSGEYVNIIAGYPAWRGFISVKDADTFVEVVPEISIAGKKLLLPGKIDDNSGAEESEKEFFRLIPAEIKELAGQFGDSNWEIVKGILRIGEDYKELIKRNRVLAYLVINLEKVNPSFSCFSDTEYVKRMILTKQKEILKHGLIIPSGRMVNIMSKIDASGLNLDTLLGLRGLSRLEGEEGEQLLKSLSHMKILSPAMVGMLGKCPRVIKYLSGKLLGELNKLPNPLGILESMLKIVVEAERLGTHVDTFEDLDSVAPRIENLKEKIKKRKEEMQKFPPQPLPDSEHIRALKNERELVYWSRRQVNCIRGFSHDVKEKRKYFYRVSCLGEEATLEIKLTKSGIMRGPLLATRNAEPSPELRKLVDKWYRTNRKAQ